jgi:branched-chain amino acid transport system permease protein
VGALAAALDLGPPQALLGLLQSRHPGLWRAAHGLPRGTAAERMARERALGELERYGFADTHPMSMFCIECGRVLDLLRISVGARALALLDEPTSGCGTADEALIKELLSRFADEGAAVLVVDHNVEVVRQTCDRIVVLEKGRLNAYGRPDDVLAPSSPQRRRSSAQLMPRQGVSHEAPGSVAGRRPAPGELQSAS